MVRDHKGWGVSGFCLFGVFCFAFVFVWVFCCCFFNDIVSNRQEKVLRKKNG